jgi:hypothetical protein
MTNDAFLIELDLLLFECDVRFEEKKREYYEGRKVSQKQYFAILDYLDRVEMDDRKRDWYILNTWDKMLESDASKILEELIEEFEDQTPLPVKQFERRCKIM